MREKKKTFGFGVDPAESQNYFLVRTPETAEGQVEIWERFDWQEGAFVLLPADTLRLRLSRARWNALSTDLAKEFNARLKEAGMSAGKFGKGDTPVEKMLGKEMLLLLWGTEDAETREFPVAQRNWHGLRPEERWWLYTMTNASTGGMQDHGRGWRAALRYILCGNPVGATQPALC